MSAEHAAKVSGMARASTPGLQAIAAWPSSVLTDSPGGKMRGLLMPKVAGYREVHQLYGPAHRKREFPGADWAFLVHAARNVASAFETIHAHGHVIGDVNQGNIVVAPSAVSKLIDCDSFQVQVDGRRYFCDVGVPQYTPPELQGKPFRGVDRTANHDNFGLAVLCFHLLFMGRHPFAGRYQGRGDMPIEKAIGEFRFAYGRAAGSKLMAPPPQTLALEAASEPVRGLFERAFAEGGAHPGARPSATEWVAALEGLGRAIRTCARHPIHKYAGSLPACPWCEVENACGVVFFIGASTQLGPQTTFDLSVVWARIDGVNAPRAEAPPALSAAAGANPRPLPAECLTTWAKVQAAIGLGPLAAERRRRAATRRAAEAAWKQGLARWTAETGDGNFQRRLRELAQARTDYTSLQAAYQRDRQEVMLRAFLEQQYIEDAKIPGIGPGLKMTLASYGIETAADVSESGVRAVPGFGEVRTFDLVQWRRDLEAQFRRAPQVAQQSAALTTIDQQYARKRQDLERHLLAGPEDLQRLRDQVNLHRTRLRAELSLLATTLAQAQADQRAK